MTDKIEITVKVNGENVPLSTLSNETIAKIKRQEELEAEENAPAICKMGDRLVLRWSLRLISEMKALGLFSTTASRYISFCPDGSVGAYNLGVTLEEAMKYYSNSGYETIFKP